jgi:type II restriction enzyme
LADKVRLRSQREGTVINFTSKKQEEEIIKALDQVVEYLDAKFGKKISLAYEKQWNLKDIVGELRQYYPEMDFHHHFETSSIRPDGGILSIKTNLANTLTYPILISEVKNQGTNDLRAQEGKPRQAKGNAIERLGKNLIGLRTALMRESIFPFVCFGYGCDFENTSSILDRVSTMAMFGRLNTTYLHNEEQGKFNRGSSQSTEK